MIVSAIVLAIIAAAIEILTGGGIPEPWRKIIWIGIVVLFVLGLVLLLAPGIIPLTTY